jgi:ABC-type proline/glycine betaine transport system permease subunit
VARGAVRNETAFVLILLATKVAFDRARRFTVTVSHVSHQSLFPSVRLWTERTLVTGLMLFALVVSVEEGLLYGGD